MFLLLVKKKFIYTDNCQKIWINKISKKRVFYSTHLLSQEKKITWKERKMIQLNVHFKDIEYFIREM